MTKQLDQQGLTKKDVLYAYVNEKSKKMNINLRSTTKKVHKENKKD
ncbi:hypothetical protein [Metabacillus herbersteinensis]